MKYVDKKSATHNVTRRARIDENRRTTKKSKYQIKSSKVIRCASKPRIPMQSKPSARESTKEKKKTTDRDNSYFSLSCFDAAVAAVDASSNISPCCCMRVCVRAEDQLFIAAAALLDAARTRTTVHSFVSILNSGMRKIRANKTTHPTTQMTKWKQKKMYKQSFRAQPGRVKLVERRRRQSARRQSMRGAADACNPNKTLTSAARICTKQGEPNRPNESMAVYRTHIFSANKRKTILT